MVRSWGRTSLDPSHPRRHKVCRIIGLSKLSPKRHSKVGRKGLRSSRLKVWGGGRDDFANWEGGGCLLNGVDSPFFAPHPLAATTRLGSVSYGLSDSGPRVRAALRAGGIKAFSLAPFGVDTMWYRIDGAMNNLNSTILNMDQKDWTFLAVVMVSVGLFCMRGFGNRRL